MRKVAGGGILEHLLCIEPAQWLGRSTADRSDIAALYDHVMNFFELHQDVYYLVDQPAVGGLDVSFTSSSMLLPFMPASLMVSTTNPDDFNRRDIRYPGEIVPPTQALNNPLARAFLGLFIEASRTLSGVAGCPLTVVQALF